MMRVQLWTWTGTGYVPPPGGPATAIIAAMGGMHRMAGLVLALLLT